MRTIKFIEQTIALIAALALTGRAAPQNPPAQTASPPKVHVPNRPSASPVQSEQGRQHSEIQFDPASGTVTLKMLVQDPQGSFIPTLHRDHFAVYENGARMHAAAVEIEHAPVTIALLTEWGGRYRSLNKVLADEVPRAAHQFLDYIGGRDKVAVYRYAGRVDQLADFTSERETLDKLFRSVEPPDFSELNFYDAFISIAARMKNIDGRKAIILVTSGIDTFSKANYNSALTAARDSGVPVYVINIGPALRDAVAWGANPGPYARIDWSRAETELHGIASASGGRLYSPRSSLDFSGIYDDIMENLRVRYVITWKSSLVGDLSAARSVRVELIDPKTAGPLQIVDAHGKPVKSRLFFETSYTPTAAPPAERQTSAAGRG